MLSGASIIANDTNGITRDVATSSASTLARLIVRTKLMNLTHNISYNNYTINASLTTYDSNSTSINVTNSTAYTQTPVLLKLARETTLPNITWEDPTPTDGYSTTRDWAMLNTTISDNSQMSAWFDWNDSLVAYWSFDYVNTTHAFDNSSNKNNLSFSGGLSTSDLVAGKRGNAFAFNGSTYVDIINDSLYEFDVDVDFTISFWAKKAGPGTGPSKGLINTGAATGTQTGFVIRIFNDDIYFGIGNGTVVTNTYYAKPFNVTDVWYHIVATADRDGNSTLYFDGVQVGTPVDISNHNVKLNAYSSQIGCWLLKNYYR